MYKRQLTDACQYGADIVVEEYIKGREFSVAVVDDKAYPIIEIAPIQGFYDYKNKYQAGSTVETCPAAVSYTHLTLPTIYSVENSVVAVSIKKKNQ